MIIGASAERPVIFAIPLLDRQVVDAGDAQAHQPVLVEFPVFVAVASEPMTTIIVPLVGEANGDAVLTESPDFLDEAVVELAVPLARQECLDRLAALEKLRAVAPAAVGRVGERDASGIARIPCVFGEAGLLCCALGGKGGKWRATHGGILD